MLLLVLSTALLTESLPAIGWSGSSRVIEAMAAGASQTCLLLKDGTIHCWGSNSMGSLGNGTTKSTTTTVKVSGITTATKVVASGNRTCALLADGTVWCWGWNLKGLLGIGTSEEVVTVPALIQDLPQAIDLDTASLHTCAVVVDGSVRCWGHGKDGQLGYYGVAKSSLTPVPVKGINSATAIVTGNYHSCALLQGGAVWCWGSNVLSPMGNPCVVPSRVADLPKAVRLGASAAHTCAVLFDRTVRCWGQNFAGQLGNGTDVSNINPSPVRGLSNVEAIELGYSHSCARLADGQMRCWGGNYVAQLGTGKEGTEHDFKVPVEVVGGNKIRLMAVGREHTCALGSDQVMRCWGWNRMAMFDSKSEGTFSTPQAIPLGLD